MGVGSVVVEATTLFLLFKTGRPKSCWLDKSNGPPLCVSQLRAAARRSTQLQAVDSMYAEARYVAHPRLQYLSKGYSTRKKFVKCLQQGTLLAACPFTHSRSNREHC